VLVVVVLVVVVLVVGATVLLVVLLVVDGAGVVVVSVVAGGAEVVLVGETGAVAIVGAPADEVGPEHPARITAATAITERRWRRRAERGTPRPYRRWSGDGGHPSLASGPR
jgi:hypothetical protein